MADNVLNILKRRRGTLEWCALASVAAVLVILIPWRNTLPEEHALHIPTHTLSNYGKYCCFAIVALGISLIWGHTGALSLGQGVFFAAGGYCVGMYLMLAIGTAGDYTSELPDFMVFLDWKELPWYWPPFRSAWFALPAAVILPGLFGFVFGFLAFRSRIRGVYFSIITQALTVALCLLLFRNNVGLGGNNGLTNFKTIVGYDLMDPAVKRNLYIASALGLTLCYGLCRFIVSTRLGRLLTAIRDSEARVRFCGYSPARFKTFVFTVAAAMSGLAGGLYVPQVGLINPSELEAGKSIEMVIWAAVGGRVSLFGAPLGAFIVNGARSFFTREYPDYWQYFLGALFVAVVMFFPDGIMGLPARIVAGYRVVMRRFGGSSATKVEVTE